jgi:hypothetical protein
MPQAYNRIEQQLYKVSKPTQNAQKGIVVKSLNQHSTSSSNPGVYLFPTPSTQHPRRNVLLIFQHCFPPNYSAQYYSTYC